jgi:hypothetical protein
MKTICLPRRWTVLLVALFAPLLPAQVVTFTNDTTIGLHNTNYDDFDVVVTNCTVTVDGPHSFASLLVQAGGVLTHTYTPGGSLANSLTIVAEPHTLAGADPVSLDQAGVDQASIVVRDDQGLVTYANDLDYLVGSDTNGFTTIGRTVGSTIPDGATVRVDYSIAVPSVPTGLNLNVTGDVTVETGGAINASGLGYGPAFGPGKGNSAGAPPSGSGGGHGGYGGISSSNAVAGAAYGVTETPTDKGSGGGNGVAGPGGTGGGAVRLTVGGALRVDGLISADGARGTNSRSGGGAGGSIWLNAQNFSGSGTISANGGAGEPSHGGGGGGGHIAVICGTNAFTGLLLAHGGTGAQRGGAGTILTQSVGQPASVLMDNGGLVGAYSSLNPSTVVRVTGTGGAILLRATARPLASLVITSNACLVAPTYQPPQAEFTVVGDVTIQRGGTILGDGAGYASLLGPGGGGFTTVQTITCGGGAGYGGPGGAGANPGASGGATYGSMSSPSDRGSGGGGLAPAWPGGSGGGTVQLIVGGTLTVNGRISADGGSPSVGGAGGGSGGSVWLTVGTLTGSGTISANGGTGDFPLGGGGGGGRIAVYYTSNSFAGALTAWGGSGTNRGGAGTIYLKPVGSGAVVVLDNGGQAGPAVPLNASNLGRLQIGSGVSCFVYPNSSLTLNTLHIEANAWLLITNRSVTVTSNATIAAGGGITADAAGYAVGAGQGAGAFIATETNSIGGGGSHGGFGGDGAHPNARGGSSFNQSYGAIHQPTTYGSGGGGSATLLQGGSGGGAVRLTVNGTLVLDGRISADGGSVVSSGGSGAGGSVWLSVGTLAGAGMISANGGTADVRYGGGGGGGRIAVYRTNNTFSGAITARGGAGFKGGGAGTIYLNAGDGSPAQVILSNGDLAGPATPISSLSGVDFFVSDRAGMSTSGSFGPRNIEIGSNSWLVAVNVLSVAGNLTIREGGACSADLLGYAPNQGVGAGRYYNSNGVVYAGGGGNVGAGGAGGHPLATGGPSSNSSSPSGSGGGGLPGGQVQGAPGGGMVFLFVNGILRVDGRISAVGGSVVGLGGGGGAGGSITLRVGELAGIGLISANGGAGDSPRSGGGGGGKIDITYTNTTFGGTIAARGGSGATRGGAGVIYLKPANEPVGLILVDNGGVLGASTSGDGSMSGHDLVLRGGAIWVQSWPPPSLRTLDVGPGCSLIAPSPYTLTVMSNATVQAGGRITADGLGYQNVFAPGAGKTYGSGNATSGGGGGYGGFGGTGTNVQASGGTPHGSATQLADWGSSGGGGAAGGAGGGGLRLNVIGILRVEGTLSGDGGNAPGQGGGGGSGGTVSLTAGSLVGSGVISANGGAGDWPNGGGGGGGRIAIYTTDSRATNTFAGTVSAWGGSGGNPGGAGTVFIRRPNDQAGKVTVDAGNFSGPSTPLTSSGWPFDLHLQRRGSAAVSGTLPLGNLLVASNCALALASAMVTIAGDATVEQGGSIVADGTGSAAGYGATSGRTYTSGSTYAGGGGHGGYGATGGSPLALGGIVTGSLTQPVSVGSGGASLTTGGAGGGAIKLTVAGTLLLDGNLSANGRDAAGSGGGGGSGGSIWLTANTLAGMGTISANGGNGDAPLGGGAGGGRIAVYCETNDFTGPVTAYGGGGANRGGAGTYFLQCSNQPSAQLVLDNGGWPGAETPFSSPGIVALTVAGGAHAVPTRTSDLLTRLQVTSGGWLTTQTGQPTLDLAVIGDAMIESGSSVTMGGRGHAQMIGPGAGQSATSIGSGAGYGGEGGSTPGAAGGTTYGSAARPVDPGSGGGLGWGPLLGGSEGGGAIRLAVGGTLTVDGNLSANGNDGWQDNAGGGSGGSLWIQAGTLAGTGAITANGGMGELWYGGGGGGGRVAVHHCTNVFTGSLTALGGDGAAWGGDGSLILAADFDAPLVLRQSPEGTVMFAVGSMYVEFDDAVSPASVAGADFGLNTPTGPLDSSSFTVQVLSSRELLFNFPPQNTPGDYQIVVGPEVENLFGQPMAAAYTGQFTLAQPLISGVVTNLSGEPVLGVTLQPGGGLPSAVTGADGTYSLPVLPSWTGAVTPALAGYVFVPGPRSYADLAAAVTGADFLMVETITPTLAVSQTGTNLMLTWPGVLGVGYSLGWSTNLVDWQDWGATIIGTNGPMQLLLPVETDPQKFFRLRAQN